METASINHAPVQSPARKIEPAKPKQQPQPSREQLLDEIAIDSAINPEEYLNNSVTPEGE